MEYPILLPPINQGGQLLDKSITLTPEEAAPLLAIGVIGEGTESEEPAPTVEVSISDPEPPAKIDLNSAEFETLIQLEVIGDVLASKLIEGRPHTSLEAARVATGLSKEKWKKIESLITVK